MKKETFKNFIEASKVINNNYVLASDYIRIFNHNVLATDGFTTLYLKDESLEKLDEFIHVDMQEVNKILKNIKENEIEIKLIDDNKKISLNERFRFTNVQTLSGADYLNEVNEGEKIQLPADFMEKFAKVSKFVGKEELRPNMMHVRLESGRMVATDAHILILAPLDVAMGERCLNIKHLPKQYNFSSLNITDKTDCYTFFDESLNFSLTKKIDDNKYPNFDQVIPTNNELLATQINKKELKNLINEALLMANHTEMIIFSFENNLCTIESSDIDCGKSYKNTFNCSYTCEPIKIGFDGKKLIKVIDTFEGEYFNFEMAAPNRAAIMKDESNIMFLLMPKMIESGYTR